MPDAKASCGPHPVRSHRHHAQSIVARFEETLLVKLGAKVWFERYPVR